MTNKNQLSRIFLLVISMVILIQPAKAYVSEFGFPAVEIVTLKSNISPPLVISHQKQFNDSVYSAYTSQKNVEILPPDGASIMISSEPVTIQNQVSKNIFTANIPNNRGGYATVIIQKIGNRIIELPGGIPIVSGI